MYGIWYVCLKHCHNKALEESCQACKKNCKEAPEDLCIVIGCVTPQRLRGVFGTPCSSDSWHVTAVMDMLFFQQTSEGVCSVTTSDRISSDVKIICGPMLMGAEEMIFSAGSEKYLDFFVNFVLMRFINSD